MASLAILNTISDFLSSDISASDNFTIAQDNASDATTPGANSQLLSNGIFSFIPFVSFLFSLAIKNQDMLKLVVIGGLIETFRRFTYRASDWLLNEWFVTAHFESSDDTYEWMMVWLGKQSVWTKAREVQISTESWGRTYHKGVEIPTEDQDQHPADNSYQTKRKLAYLPAFDTKQWLRYKGTWMSVSRTQMQPTNPWLAGRESLEICLFARNNRILKSLLYDAKKAYNAEDENTVEIYGANQGNDDWYRISTRNRRPFQSIILEPEIKNMVLDDAKEFLSSGKWYTDRGLPYRRGYLLHGVPGSGKTSLIHSIAGELGLDIYVVSLAKRGLDDSGLNSLICELPPRSIALMEDIDAAFHQTAIARDGVSGSKTETSAGLSTQSPNGARDSDPKGVTLSGLLNALDGIVAQEGRILFATTNRYDSIDEALCRPGRMDVHVEFTMATKWQIKELFRCFFPPSEVAEVEEEDTVVLKKFPGVDVKGVELATQLSREETDALAEKFAEAVPEGHFSMASLQGHLMRHKDRPHDAVDAVAAWVEKESRKRGLTVKKQST